MSPPGPEGARKVTEMGGGLSGLSLSPIVDQKTHTRFLCMVCRINNVKTLSPLSPLPYKPTGQGLQLGTLFSTGAIGSAPVWGAGGRRFKSCRSPNILLPKQALFDPRLRKPLL